MDSAVEIIIYSLAVILLVLGIIGCVAPILPGPILAYAALFCLIPTGDSPSVATFVIFGILTVVVTIADSVIPAIGAKKFDCSRWGTWGCFIGTIVGVFFFPVGLAAGPFLGAFIGELIAGKTACAALRGGVGALLGFLAGTVLKFAVCIAIAVAVFMRLF